MRLTRGPPSPLSIVRLDPQIHPERLPRNVQVLRLLQRRPEHRVDALCGRTLDIPER